MELQIITVWGYRKGMLQVPLPELRVPKCSSVGLKEKKRCLQGRSWAARVLVTHRNKSGCSPMQPEVSGAARSCGCRRCLCQGLPAAPAFAREPGRVGRRASRDRFERDDREGGLFQEDLLQSAQARKHVAGLMWRVTAAACRCAGCQRHCFHCAESASSPPLVPRYQSRSRFTFPHGSTVGRGAGGSLRLEEPIPVLKDCRTAKKPIPCKTRAARWTELLPEITPRRKERAAPTTLAGGERSCHVSEGAHA